MLVNPGILSFRSRTSSYSRSAATEIDMERDPRATSRKTSLEAPRLERNAATMTLVSTTRCTYGIVYATEFEASYIFCERPRLLAPTCFWRQRLLRRRRAKSAEGMGFKCIGLFEFFSFTGALGSRFSESGSIAQLRGRAGPYKVVGHSWGAVVECLERD